MSERKASDLVVVNDRISRLVYAGLLSRLEIVDEIKRTDADVPVEVIAAEVDTAMDAKLIAEASWPELTDCDRLWNAFDEINSSGILALHSPAATMDMCEFACITQWEQDGGPSSGRIAYLYYHTDDLENVVVTGDLMLAYACFEQHPGLHDLPLMQEMIGHRVVEILRKHGLKVDWNGNTAEKIAVKLTWLKRGEPEMVEHRILLQTDVIDDWDLLSLRTSELSTLDG